MINIDETVIDFVAKGFQIPAKPDILTQLQHVMSKPESSAADEAKVIAKDVSLSGAILKTINSPFFGLRKKISNVEQAVSFLGLDIVNDLVTALLFRDAFDNITCCLSLERFWDDSKDVANAMTFISKQVSPAIKDDLLYSIGLFHNCGIPAFSNKFDDYKETLIAANSMNENSIRLEQSKYGSDHAIIGYYIASSWQLPKTVCSIILNHHELDFLSSNNSKEDNIRFAILKLAENLVDRNKRHNQSPDWEKVQTTVFDLLNMDQQDFLAMERTYTELL